MTISAHCLHAGRKLKGCVGGLCPILNTMHGLDPHAPSAPKRTASSGTSGQATSAQPHPPKLTRECCKLTCSSPVAHRGGLASGLLDKIALRSLTLLEAVSWALPLKVAHGQLWLIYSRIAWGSTGTEQVCTPLQRCTPCALSDNRYGGSAMSSCLRFRTSA